MKSQLRQAAKILWSEGPVVLLTKSGNYGYRTVATRFFPTRCAEAPHCPETADRLNETLGTAELQSKAAVMQATPISLMIESTTYCNIKCVMCPQALEGFEQRHLDVGLLDQLTPFIRAARRIQLHGIGEVLVSPTFWRALDAITTWHEGAPFLSVNTNALLLNEKNIARLLASKISELNVSMDAATADTYEKIRGADFTRLLNNIEAFMRARSRAGRTHDLRVMVNMTLMRANIEELPDFIRLAKRLGVDEVQFWRMNDGDYYHAKEWIVDKGEWQFSYLDELPAHYPNLFNSTIRESLRIGEEIGMPICKYTADTAMVEGENVVEDREYRPVPKKAPTADPLQIISLEQPSAEAIQVAAPSPPPLQLVTIANPQAVTQPADVGSSSARPKSELIRNCHAPWHWMMVRKDGGCAPCCHMTPIGNLNELSPEEFWNGPAMQEIRSSIAVGEVSQYCAGASCPYVRDVA